MSQTLKPDLPIWPPVPDTRVTPGTEPAGGEARDRTSTETRSEPAEHPAGSVPGTPGGFDGFGSLAG